MEEKEGKERLNLLARVMLPTTWQLLSRIGLSPGDELPRCRLRWRPHITFYGRVIGPNGSVVGTDTDEAILELAKEDAAIAKLGNVEFRHVDACVAQCRESFDLVYARFLLSHLNQPGKCIEAMVKACRSGGIIVVEDIDFVGSFCHPVSTAYERYVELYTKVVQRRGGDPNIAAQTTGMLRKAGLKAIGLNVVQPAHIEGEAS